MRLGKPALAAALCTGLGFFATVPLPLTGARSQSTPAESLPDAPGKEIFQIICNTCHDGATAVVGKSWTWTEWDLKVTEMLQEYEIDHPLEPPVTDEEYDAIVGYLAGSFPPETVEVNRMEAMDLAFGLGISREDGEAIVRVREENGPFETLEDLLQVPGLDASPIRARQDRLTFEAEE